MKPLSLRPFPVASEPLSDFLERLANANGYQARELWSILDRGEFSHEKVLSDALNGYPLPTFSGPSIPKVDIPVNVFGLHSSDFTHLRKRWCPMCIENSAWFRPIWRLKVATICVFHRIRLLQRCPQCNIYPSSSSILRGSCECGLHFIRVNTPAAHQEIQLSAVLESSLMQAATLNLGEILLTLNTSQITRLICYSGRLVEGPSLRRPGQIRELEDLTVASCLVAGTSSLLANWPSAFWHCLERFVEAAPDDASIRRVFGSLYHVLYQDLRDSAFQFFRDAFELFLLEHWRGELCGRHRLFSSETIHKHRHQGLARVSRAAGMGRDRLRQMIHQDRFPANQFNPNSARHIITVDKELLAKLIPNPTDYLDLRTTARLLGLKRTRLRQLVAHGAILADAKPDFRRSNRWHFRRNEVESFINEIRTNSVLELPEGGTVTLRHILQFWRIAATELGELIRTLKLRQISFIALSGCRLCELIFNESELRTWLDKTRAVTIKWVSVPIASKHLGLKEQVVYELVSRNFLVADVISKNGHATRRISLQSLDQFKQVYVSAFELAQQHCTSSTAILQRVAAKPITGPKIDGGRQYFFRRNDI